MLQNSYNFRQIHKSVFTKCICIWMRACGRYLGCILSPWPTAAWVASWGTSSAWFGPSSGPCLLRSWRTAWRLENAKTIIDVGRLSGSQRWDRSHDLRLRFSTPPADFSSCAASEQEIFSYKSPSSSSEWWSWYSWGESSRGFSHYWLHSNYIGKVV